MSSIPDEAFKRAHEDPPSGAPASSERSLYRVGRHLAQTLERDALVQKTTHEMREKLNVDRVVLYYFYRQWKGQVTFESLSSPKLSIIGTTGADECFNDQYAKLYLEGRVRAINDVQSEAIQPCHQTFLNSLQVKSNLVVPVLTTKGLWGLLIAHHCRTTRTWSSEDLKSMETGAQALSKAPSIARS